MKWSARKIASIALLLAALLSLFMNWLGLSGAARRELEDYVGGRDVADYVADELEDAIEDLTDTLDRYDIPYQQSKFTKMTGILTDMAVSPGDVNFIGGVAGDYIKGVQKLEREYDTHILDEDAAGAAKTTFLVYRVIYIAALLTLLLYAALHVLGKKGRGVPALICGLLLLGAFVFLCAALNASMREALFSLTLWPFLFIACIIASMVLWGKAYREQSAGTAPVPGKASVMAAAQAGPSAPARSAALQTEGGDWVCPVCSAACPAEGRFCPTCGAKKPE